MMDIVIDDSFTYPIGSELYNETIHMCLPDKQIDDLMDVKAKCNESITRRMTVFDFILDAVIWESFLISLSRSTSPIIAFLFDDLCINDKDWYLFYYNRDH